MNLIDNLRDQGHDDKTIQRTLSFARTAANKKGMGDTEFNTRLGISQFESSPLQEWLVSKAKEAYGDDGARFTKEMFTLDDFFSSGLEYSTGALAFDGPSEKAKKISTMSKGDGTVGTLQAGAEMLGTIVGDTPLGVAGFFGGGATGGPIGAMAGAFALPTVFRTALLDAYENGDIDTVDRFWDVLTKTGIEGLKSYVTGAATGGVGQVAKPIAGKYISNKVLRTVAVTEAEVAAFTAVGAGLEGRLPTMQDFAAANVAIFGLKAAVSTTKGTVVAAKKQIAKVYEHTGIRPSELITRANEDASIKEDLASSTQEIPRSLQNPDQKAAAKDTTWDPESTKTKEWQEATAKKVYNTTEEAFGELSLDSIMKVTETPEQLDLIYTRILKDHKLEELPQSVANSMRTFVENNQGKVKDFEEAFVTLNEPLIVYRGTSEKGLESTVSSSLAPDVAFTRADKNYGNLYRITLPEGTRVALPSRSTPVESLKSEFEVIIHPSEKIVEVRSQPNKAPVEVTGPLDAVPETNIQIIGDATVQRPESVSQLNAKISVGGKPEKTRYGWKELYRDVVDDLHPLKTITEALADGKVIPADKNPFTLARLYRGVAGIADSFLDHGALDFANKNRVSKPLREILLPLGQAGQIDAFREYAVARRAIELNKRGIETGIDIKSAINVVNSNPSLRKAFNDLRDYQTKVIEYLRDSGVLSVEALEAIKEANYDYVPFNRVFAPDKSGGMGLRSLSPVKKIKGSIKDIVDPLESIIRNTYAMVTIAERNRIMTSLVELQAANPKLEVLKPAKASNTTTKLEGAELVKMLEPYIGKETSKIPDDASFTVFRKKMFVKDNDMVHMVNGKAKVYEINTELAEALNAMDRDALPGVIKFLSLPATLLRTGAILSPDFMARNTIRDTISATLFSKDGFIPVIDTFRGMGMILGKTDAYKDWAASGGMFSHMQAVDRVYLQKGIKDMLTAIPLRNTLRNPIEILRSIGSLTEQGTRVAAFERRRTKAIKQGKSRSEAMAEAGFESRDLTLDFQRFGAKGRAVNSMSVFLNAWIQGLDKTARSFIENPVAMTTKVMAGIAIPSAALHLINMGEKDPDGVLWYNELPDWQRDLYWHWSSGEGKDFTIWRAPKPFELGLIFGTGTERFIDYQLATDPKAMSKFAKSVGKSLVPNLLPTILTVPTEIYFNKSIFFDRPIVPRAREGMLPEYQHGIYTSETAKEIGKIIQAIPPARFSKMASGAVVEHLIRGWTGGLGTYALQAMDYVLKKSGVVDTSIVPPESTLSDIPLVKAFVTRYPSMNTQSIEKFYKNHAKIKMFTDSHKKLMKEGNIVEAQKVYKEQLGSGLIIKVDGYQKTISSMSKMIRMIHLTPKMEGMSRKQLASWKREKIDSLYVQINSIAGAGNDLVKQIQDRLTKNK
tara:strand:+ start:2896 stop:7131 length:4236 start_codon:yes stop_codon:yes gene_type:complete